MRLIREGWRVDRGREIRGVFSGTGSPVGSTMKIIFLVLRQMEKFMYGTT